MAAEHTIQNVWYVIRPQLAAGNVYVPSFLPHEVTNMLNKVTRIQEFFEAK